ncbi:hypothetical protein Q8A67_024109 [Cirrhinus molitorella]|uniref:Uncharacterized protein n=1 Tax=Cirrhinus molitorella TaxID=172907 RepID=A0AA88TA56_9TELE|nr:hypothetical protein Q8A67_024109 [Cirrhinus molitorella]
MLKASGIWLSAASDSSCPTTLPPLDRRSHQKLPKTPQHTQLNIRASVIFVQKTRCFSGPHSATTSQHPHLLITVSINLEMSVCVSYIP